MKLWEQSYLSRIDYRIVSVVVSHCSKVDWLLVEYFPDLPHLDPFIDLLIENLADAINTDILFDFSVAVFIWFANTGFW